MYVKLARLTSILALTLFQTGLGVAALDGRFREECFRESFKAVLKQAGENIATVAVWAMPRPVRAGEDDWAAASALFRTS
jgi:hypothetical protein